MKKIFLVLVLFCFSISAQEIFYETSQQLEQRMNWWREARFGMFIHWGLYAIPAGEWNGNTNHGEWIRTTAQIPLKEYKKFSSQFIPHQFNAEEWVKIAKDAGMKYIVITSKHHDGFCLFDSKETDFDVMNTPFKRDILKELSDACKKYGLKICWYHSIMDWNHTDYLPRREWEKDRSIEEADFNRFIKYLKAQLKELLTNYGEIGVLWFDGEWETTWNEKFGIEIYNYVRKLQPNIIVNNRVGVSRSGMEGLTKEGGFGGDFGTPEQQIPATGLPGVDWETCMTMNDHWGYNKHDKNFKSAKELIQMLADIASKGGNYLLNVGPTAEGIFPQESVELLKEIGNWMNVNGESIYATQASPFEKLDWGRCTKKKIGNDTRLYFHVFNWPISGKLVIPGIYNDPIKAYLLSDQSKKLLHIVREEDALIIIVPKKAPDQNNSVVILEVVGREDVSNPPIIEETVNIFINTKEIKLKSERENVEIRYTIDGSTPTIDSPLYNKRIKIDNSATLKTRCFRNGKAVSEISEEAFTKVKPENPVNLKSPTNGILYYYYEGDWDKLPDFSSEVLLKEGSLSNFDFSPRKNVENFGFSFIGYIKIPKEDVYTFYTESDDGSSLYINDKLVVNNDELHGMVEKKGVIALSEGFYSIKCNFFEKTGGDGLKVSIESEGMKKQLIPDSMLYYKKMN